MERIEVSFGPYLVHVKEIRGPYSQTNRTLARPLTDGDVLRMILDVVKRSPQIQELREETRWNYLRALEETLLTSPHVGQMDVSLSLTDDGCRDTFLGVEQPFVVTLEPEAPPRSNNPAHVMAAALRGLGLPVNASWVERMAEICGRPVSDLPLGGEVEDRPPRGITVNGGHPLGLEVETPHRPFLAGNAPHMMVTDDVIETPNTDEDGTRTLRSAFQSFHNRLLGLQRLLPVDEDDGEGREMNGLRSYLQRVLPEALMRRLDEEDQPIITGEGQPVATDADGNPTQGLIGLDLAAAGTDRAAALLMVQGQYAVVRWDTLDGISEEMADAMAASLEWTGEPEFGMRVDLALNNGDAINGTMRASGIIVPLGELNEVTVQLLDADGNPVGGPLPATLETAADTAEDEAAADPNLPPVAKNDNGDLAECVFCNKKPARIWAEGFAPECDECASHWETPNDED